MRVDETSRLGSDRGPSIDKRWFMTSVSVGSVSATGHTERRKCSNRSAKRSSRHVLVARSPQRFVVKKHSTRRRYGKRWRIGEDGNRRIFEIWSRDQDQATDGTEAKRQHYRSS